VVVRRKIHGFEFPFFPSEEAVHGGFERLVSFEVEINPTLCQYN
jgi:hypothetical protein